MSQIKNTYGCYIPGNVKSDSRLTFFERLLYGEISTLCVRHGYCWATNTYLASLFDVDKRTVINGINKLCELGYVRKDKISNSKRVLAILNNISNDKACSFIDTSVKSENINNSPNVILLNKGVKNYTTTEQPGVKNYTHNNINNKVYKDNNYNANILSKDNILVSKYDISTTNKSTLKQLQQSVKGKNQVEQLFKAKCISTNQELTKTPKQQKISTNLVNYFITNYQKDVPKCVCDKFCKWIKYQVELGCKASKTFVDTNIQLVKDRLKLVDESIVCQLIDKAMTTQHKTLLYIFDEHLKTLKFRTTVNNNGDTVLIPINRFDSNGNNYMCSPRVIPNQNNMLKDEQETKQIVDNYVHGVTFVSKIY